MIVNAADISRYGHMHAGGFTIIGDEAGYLCLRFVDVRSVNFYKTLPNDITASRSSLLAALLRLLKKDCFLKITFPVSCGKKE